MSSTAPSYPRPDSYHDLGFDPRRWVYAGLTALFVLIGVAVVIGVAVPALRGQIPSWSTDVAPWNWILALIGFVIAIWIIVWVVRFLFWGLSGAAYVPPYWRHYYRKYGPGGPFGSDPAVEIARERFARGEISQDQLDQILRQLEKGSGPLPPS
jgi:uncharacterized membrane protein